MHDSADVQEQNRTSAYTGLSTVYANIFSE